MHSPARIAVSRSRGLTVQWQDGHASHYDLKYLHDRCPCAACAARPAPATEASSPFVMFQPALGISSVEPIGAYALRINFNDGHNTGLYSFEHLREICPCPECARTR